jgi:tRNA(Ile)-lysidine synthase
MVIRNRLTPAVADVRRAVRNSLDALNLEPDSRVLVACSGGPDSMALAAALIFEGPKLGLRVSAVVVDHGLQEASSKVAQSTAAKLEELGVDPVVIETITVVESGNGPEAAARTARYEALERARKLVRLYFWVTTLKIKPRLFCLDLRVARVCAQLRACRILIKTKS